MLSFTRKSVFTLLAVLAASAIAVSGCGKKEAADPAAKATAPQAATASAPAEEQSAMPVPSNEPITEERTYFDFESDLNGWEVPMWAEGKSDYVARGAVVSREVASKGTGSMKVQSEFPGGKWTASLVEIQMYLNLAKYRVVSADLYIPAEAPIGLKAKLIITVGDTWKFVEMANSVPLIPGEWVTVTASIEPGSYDWKRVVPDEDFAKDVRKIAIRVESNNKPTYTGPIYIDNIRVGR